MKKFLLFILLISMSVFAVELDELVIIHSKHDKQSREFVAANPGYQVISWYDEKPTELKVRYLSLDMPPVSQFPSVVNTKSKMISHAPPTMVAAVSDISNKQLSIDTVATININEKALKDDIRKMSKDIDDSSLEPKIKKILKALIKDFR